MNGVDKGESKLELAFNIPGDTEGNSELTGDGGNNNSGNFTCAEVEVYQVTKQ